MVNFEPPLRKSLPESQLFKILSEIPADSEGMQRASELMAEHERNLAEDEANLAAWAAELEADGSPEALAALARQRGESVLSAEEPEQQQPHPTAPTPLVTAEPLSPPLRPNEPQQPRVSFESLLTGSTPIVSDAPAAPEVIGSSEEARHSFLDFLFLPLALGLGLFAAELSAAQAVLTAGAIALGIILALIASRGGVSFSGHLASVSLGVTLGRVAVALALVAALLALAPSTLDAATNISTLGSLDWLAAAVVGLFAIGLGAFRTAWLPRAIALVPLGAFVWLAIESSFTAVSFEELALADLALVGVGAFAGFWVQAFALPLNRTGRYVFGSTSIVFVAAAGVLGSAVTVNPSQRSWAVAAAALVLIYALGREAASGARRASVNPLAALLPLALLGLWVVSPISVDATPWLLLIASGFIGLFVSDALLRSQPIHLPSTEQPFGFYGAFSITAAIVWLIALASATFALLATGVLDAGFGQIFDVPWFTDYAAISLAVAVSLIVGMMRFSVVRARELDQLSASGDTKLENLLGL
jgi:hypothetical protein